MSQSPSSKRRGGKGKTASRIKVIEKAKSLSQGVDGETSEAGLLEPKKQKKSPASMVDIGFLGARMGRQQRGGKAILLQRRKNQKREVAYGGGRDGAC